MMVHVLVLHFLLWRPWASSIILRPLLVLMIPIKVHTTLSFIYVLLLVYILGLIMVMCVVAYTICMNLLVLDQVFNLNHWCKTSQWKDWCTWIYFDEQTLSCSFDLLMMYNMYTISPSLALVELSWEYRLEVNIFENITHVLTLFDLSVCSVFWLRGNDEEQ